MAITIEMPRLSDSMHEGTVLRWLKKTGDFVKVGDHLADIETDKAHVELQACEDGTLTEILVPEGGSAAAGAPIALLQPEFGAAACGCPPRPSATCSPLAARLAAEAGLNPATLRGTGPRGKSWPRMYGPPCAPRTAPPAGCRPRWRPGTRATPRA